MTMTLNALMAAYVAELRDGEIADPFAARLTLAAVWCDLADLAGETPPPDVVALLDVPVLLIPPCDLCQGLGLFDDIPCPRCGGAGSGAGHSCYTRSGAPSPGPVSTATETGPFRVRPRAAAPCAMLRVGELLVARLQPGSNSQRPAGRIGAVSWTPAMSR